MVDTIAPAVGGSRVQNYRLAWMTHLVGAALAAAATGAVLGLAGRLAGAPWEGMSPLLVAAVALLYATREAFGLPIPLPQGRAQVPEWWRSFFPLPVASFLYGIGLGVGFYTYLGAGTYVAVSAAAVSVGDPLAGALVCLPFGLARGLSLPLAGRLGARAIDRLEELSSGSGIRVVNSATLAAVAGAAALVAVSSA